VGSKDFEYVRGFGAETVIDYQGGNFESFASPVDVIIDTLGGNTFHASKV
jgi:NADPH:quinone reductase-like Zn-dependent oxidoreductase